MQSGFALKILRLYIIQKPDCLIREQKLWNIDKGRADRPFIFQPRWNDMDYAGNLLVF